MLPIVLVTGFLGSGKTTLMRRLILDAHRRQLRAAVVVNEFGTADVDSHILGQADAELIAAIAGGCACCSGQDELQETLLELSLRDETTRPDVVLLEASGLADPVLLLDVITASALVSCVRADTIVSVVDSARYLEMATSLGPLLRRQTQLADILVLNKVDLAERSQLDRIEAKMRELAPHAELVFTRECEFDLESFWRRVLTQRSRAERQVDSDDRADAAGHASAHTLTCPLPHPVERARLEAALQALPPEVWRAKGFVRLRGEEQLQLVQYTGGLQEAGRYHIAPFYLPFGAPEPATALVFIGAHLEPQLVADFGGTAKLLPMI